MNSPDGIKFIKQLVAAADVIVEAFRPGVMDKFGLDYANVHKMNPRLVYCSISAFGQNGPMSDRGGYDTLIQAMSGMMDMTGEPDGQPTKLGFPVVDYGTAHLCFGAIAAALYKREKTGKGQWIDASLFSTAIAMNHFLEQTSAGVSVSRNGNLSKVTAPVGNYSGKNGTLTISCNNDKMFNRLAKALNLDWMIDDPQYSTNVARGNNTFKVAEIIEARLSEFDDINEAERLLYDAGVPCAKVNNNEEAIELAKYAGHGCVAELDLGEGLDRKTLLTRGIPFKMSDTPGKLAPASHELGADTIDVLIEMGYSREEAEKLASSWSV